MALESKAPILANQPKLSSSNHTKEETLIHFELDKLLTTVRSSFNFVEMHVLHLV